MLKALDIVNPSLKPPLSQVSVVFGIKLFPTSPDALLKLISKTCPPVFSSIPQERAL